MNPETIIITTKYNFYLTSNHDLYSFGVLDIFCIDSSAECMRNVISALFYLYKLTATHFYRDTRRLQQREGTKLQNLMGLINVMDIIIIIIIIMNKYVSI